MHRGTISSAKEIAIEANFTGKSYWSKSDVWHLLNRSANQTLAVNIEFNLN